MNCNVPNWSKIVFDQIQNVKIYTLHELNISLEVLKRLFEPILGGLSLPSLDFYGSEHIELVCNIIFLPEMSKFALPKTVGII